MKCPTCNNEINYDIIRAQDDAVHCTRCNGTFSKSALYDERNKEFNMNVPPSGCWVKKKKDAVIVGASTRSKLAFFLVPFLLIWTIGTVGQLWVSQIVNGKFDLFDTLFGLPFLVVTIIICVITLMKIAGKVELTLNKQGGSVFTGLGDVGVTRDFNWDEISAVSEKETFFGREGKRAFVIIFEGKKRVAFGLGLDASKRYYLLRSIQKFMEIVNAKRN